MIDRLTRQARRVVADSKLWGRVPEYAILTGQWDQGELVQAALQDVLKNRPEIVDE